MKEYMSDKDFEMAGTREENREEFKTLVDVCEKSIRMLEKHWHREMAPIHEGEKYEDVKFLIRDALIGLRSKVMSLELSIKGLEVNEIIPKRNILEKLFVRAYGESEWHCVHDYEEFIKRYPKGTNIVVKHVMTRVGKVTL